MPELGRITEIRVTKLDADGKPVGSPVLIATPQYAPQCAVHCAEAMSIGLPDTECEARCVYLDHPDNV